MTIVAGNRGNQPVGRIDASMPEDALITRPDLEVLLRRLPPGGATFIESLMSGRSLGEAAASALEISSSFDIAANIAGMIDAGAFTKIILGEAR